MTQHWSGTTINKQDWTTPQEFVEFIENEYQVTFVLDVAASEHNKKAPLYIDIEADGLSKSWEFNREGTTTIWCNPPYANQKDWVLKAIHESYYGRADVFMLIPARTSTKLFHDWIIPNALSIGFVRGRLNFGGDESRGTCAFPSMIVRFKKHSQKFSKTPRFLTLEPTKKERGLQ